MKVGRLSRNPWISQVALKTRKGAASLMDNPLQPAGHCPAQSPALNSFNLAQVNFSSTDVPIDIGIPSRRQISSRADSPTLVKAEICSVPLIVSGNSKVQARRCSERENNPSEQGFEGGKKFRLSESSVLVLHEGDITKWSVDGRTDAIVNAANERMLGGGGVDGAIHIAAGADLLKACRKLPKAPDGVRCPVGTAVVTEGFGLPVSRIIHAVGPIYGQDDAHGNILRNTYKSSLDLAAEQGIKYLAFPAISCGIYRYPPDRAAEVALQTIRDHSQKFLEIHFVLFEGRTWRSWLDKANQLFDPVET